MVNKTSKTLKQILNNDYVIACIGTDKYIADATAPMIGTMLKKSNCPIPVIGTMHEPIHAMNINEKINYINENYKGKKVLAIDSCIGNDIGKIELREKPIFPAKGVGKELPPIGDYSIIIETEKDKHNLFMNNTRLSFIVDCAENVVNEILNCFKRDD